jgi:hypothetical protein
MAAFDPHAYAIAVEAWRARYAGREDALEATWARAEIEERRAEAIFLAGEAGAATHYHAALRALVPQGARFDSAEENDRRMQAYRRITERLYQIGPDGRSRSAPLQPPAPAAFAPPALPPPPPPAPAAFAAPAFPPPPPRSHIDQLHRDADHWHRYRLASLWFDAARMLAPRFPRQAARACEWSVRYYERYREDWSAHLPASRWDSDGGAEMAEVRSFAAGLGAGDPDASPPLWVERLTDGDWVAALDALGAGAPDPNLRPLALLLADACVCGGLPDAAARLLR